MALDGGSRGYLWQDTSFSVPSHLAEMGWPYTLQSTNTNCCTLQGAGPGHGRVCGGKRPRSLADVNTGLAIFALATEIWLEASVGQEAEVAEVDRCFPGIPGALQITARG